MSESGEVLAQIDGNERHTGNEIYGADSRHGFSSFAGADKAREILLSEAARHIVAVLQWSWAWREVIEGGNDLLRDLVRRILAEGVRRDGVRTDLKVGGIARVASEVFISYRLGDREARAA